MRKRKCINYLMFTIQYTNDDGGRAVAMAMLLPPPTKPITRPDSVVLVREEKEKSTLSHVLKGEE